MDKYRPVDDTGLCLKSNQYIVDMTEIVKQVSDYSPSAVYLNEIVGSKAFLKLASAGVNPCPCCDMTAYALSNYEDA